MEFREILRNFTKLYNTEFNGIPCNFSQYRTEYGIDGSKKNRRNSVSTEFRGHPSCELAGCLRTPAYRRPQVHNSWLRPNQTLVSYTLAGLA